MNKKYIYIGAEWCGPCKVFKPKFEAICKEKGLNYEILDVEKDEERVNKYNVRSVPTIIIEENGVIVMKEMAAKIINLL